MWNLVQVGKCLLFECPSRWYLGIVAERSAGTAVLTDVLCLHLISDLGVFLSGKIPKETEATPMERIEINLGTLESVTPFPKSALADVRKRTHPETEEQS